MKYRVSWDMRGFQRYKDFDDLDSAEDFAVILGTSVEILPDPKPTPTVKVVVTGLYGIDDTDNLINLLYGINNGSVTATIDITTRPHPTPSEEGPPGTVGAMRELMAHAPDDYPFDVYSSELGHSVGFDLNEGHDENDIAGFTLFVHC